MEEELSCVDEPCNALTLSSLFHILLSVPLFPKSIFSILVGCCQQLSVHWMNWLSEIQKLTSFISIICIFFASVINFNPSIFFVITFVNTGINLKWNKFYLYRMRVLLTPTISDLPVDIAVPDAPKHHGKSVCVLWAFRWTVHSASTVLFCMTTMKSASFL